jgi:hypothetical protein
VHNMRYESTLASAFPKATWKLDRPTRPDQGIQLEAAAGIEPPYSQDSADQVSLMATSLAALHYPSRYQSAAQEMVTKTQSLAASLRSGSVGTNSSNALLSAVTASQQFYGLLGIPSACTTTSS